MKQIIAVAGVIRKSGKILITKRLENAALGPGKWEFPGGKLEPNESLQECLAREVMEELGVAIKPQKLFHAFSYMYSPELQVILIVFTARITSGSPKTIGCSSFKWAEPEELSKYDFLESNREVIRKLSRYEKNASPGI